MQEITDGRKRMSVLMVEDNAVDAYLTTEILSESEKTSYVVSTVRDGSEALSFLRRINSHKNAPRPDLIFLDLNLPGMHGLDFLDRIKTDPGLKGIPVCVLTTSESAEDVEKAKELNAECYLVKPLDLEKFEDTFNTILGRSNV